MISVYTSHYALLYFQLETVEAQYVSLTDINHCLAWICITIIIFDCLNISLELSSFCKSFVTLLTSANPGD